MMLRGLIVSIVLSLCASFAVAQDESLANELFEAGNYEDALEEYFVLSEESDNLEYQFKIGVCFLNTNIDKSKAIDYLIKCIDAKPFSKDQDYLLGRAYHYAYQFDEAIKYLTKFKEVGKGSDENLADVDMQIEYCQNAKELMKFPINVSFENLGSKVNSAFDDYYPFIPKDESFLLFNSRRDDESSQNENGTYKSNIYISNVEDGKYEKPKPINFNINTKEENEEVVGMNASGSKAIIYTENYNKGEVIGLSNIVNKAVSIPEPFPGTINTKGKEIAATLTEDGRTLYFASNMPGGYGGIDIYKCHILPNGKWSEPQILDANINTPNDEDFPNISLDGNTLYFSSKGHTSMGGYDIFKAELDPIKRKPILVQNLGYPINTPEDNMNLRISESGRHGYISTVRAGGQGNLDIYRVTFNQIEPRYTVVTGGIVSEKDNSSVGGAFVSVIDLDSGEIYGDYTPNEKTGRYVMILPPGEYEVLIESDDFEEYIEEIKILDKASFKPLISKDFPLKAF